MYKNSVLEQLSDRRLWNSRTGVERVASPEPGSSISLGQSGLLEPHLLGPGLAILE